MQDLVVILIITVILALIVFYLIRRKKKGKGCIGCPYADSCNHKCNKNPND